MRITVVGNCQHAGVAGCLHVMLVDAQVHMVATNRRLLADQEIRDVLAASDVIATQPNFKAAIAEAFPQKRIVEYPRIVFAGYYPDFVQAKAGQEVIQSPIGVFHSSIAVWAYANRLSVEQTLALFRGEVFDALRFQAVWDVSIKRMQAECGVAGMPIDGALTRWLRRHPFMHATVHPKIFVMADIARHVVEQIGASCSIDAAEDYMPDYLANSQVWPIYPDIAKQHGFSGNYIFKIHKGRPSSDPAAGKRKKDMTTTFEMFDIAEFIERSFRLYGAHDPASISHARMDKGHYDCLLPFVSSAGGMRSAPVTDAGPKPVQEAAVPAEKPAPSARGSNSPYVGLPDHQYWRQAIEQVQAGDVDPVVASELRIGRTTAIATAGSCFAQNIARSLVHRGYNYFVTETAPPSLTPAEAARLSYGIFSARYGNLYTAKQLDQLFDRAYGKFVPQDSAWRRTDGRFVDPFRPRIEPNGYADAGEVAAARAPHLAAVREMLEKTDVFIFTLGLTEAWRSKADGAVFPLAPGVSAGEFDPSRYEFVNFGVEEVVADMTSFINRLRTINPKVQVVLTVSPVPLIATFEPRHVLVSTAASKAVLRVAADMVTKAFGFVHYFPSYEVITGSFSRGQYFEQDARSVTPSGVDHAMKLFARHYLEPETDQAIEDNLYGEILGIAGIVCDEEEMRIARGEK